MNRSPIVSLLLIVLIAGAAGTYYARNWWSSQGTFLRAYGAEGIIMKTSRYQSSVRDEIWSLTPGDVRRMEEKLEGHVAAATNRFRNIAPDFRRYYRQYYAWQNSQGRYITTEFYHPRLVTRYEWLHRTPMARGDVGTYWRIDFDVNRGTFENFRLRPGVDP